MGADIAVPTLNINSVMMSFGQRMIMFDCVEDGRMATPFSNMSRRLISE